MKTKEKKLNKLHFTPVTEEQLFKVRELRKIGVITTVLIRQLIDDKYDEYFKDKETQK